MFTEENTTVNIISYKQIADDLPVHAYISPHPLDEDANVELDWMSWIPGFSLEFDEDEDASTALFNEHNLALYSAIEKHVEAKFIRAFENLAPLFKDYTIKNMYVRLDIQGLTSDKNSLANYFYYRSKPHCGIYQFTADLLLIKYYVYGKLNELSPESRLHYVWEHELLHMLDHTMTQKSSVYFNSEEVSEQYKYFLLKFREEGLAELYYLLHGYYDEVQSTEQALQIFRQLNTEVKVYCENQKQFPKEVYKRYAYYELGPWMMLDMLRTFEGMFHQDLIEEALHKIACKQALTKEQIHEIIIIALRVDLPDFLHYCKTILSTEPKL